MKNTAEVSLLVKIGLCSLTRNSLRVPFDAALMKLTIEIIDTGMGLKIVYEGSEDYKYRMLWVKKGANLAVIEPQTCAIDCFHLEEPADKKGLIVIEPNSSKELITKFYISANM